VFTISHVDLMSDGPYSHYTIFMIVFGHVLSLVIVGVIVFNWPFSHVLKVKKGAVGVCCQTVSEAEAMVHQGGIEDVFISNQVMSSTSPPAAVISYITFRLLGSQSWSEWPRCAERRRFQCASTTPRTSLLLEKQPKTPKSTSHAL
jgi:hypothetical protein